MRTYQAPGVYLAPQPPPEADVRLVRTDIAGFVGYAERGPIAPADSATLADPNCLAVPLTSWDQYRATFGGLTHYAYMPYAVRAFFENGGTKCYVVRVAASTSTVPFAVPRTASFTLATGDDGTQVTTLSQALASGLNTLSVASTQGLAPGDVISIGETSRPVQAVVATVLDPHNLTLSGLLAAGVAAGAEVWLLATTLSQSSSPGQTTLSVGSTAGLTSGAVIAIGDVTGPVVATVANVYAAQYLTLSSPLATGVPVSASVWLKSTTLTLASAPGTNSLTVDSTKALAPGAMIAIGDLTAPPVAVAVVATVVDANNLTLSGSVATAAAAGAAVRKLSATVLPNQVTAGQIVVQVASTAGLSAGGTVVVTADGMTEVATVDGVVDATTVRLTRKLQGAYPAGALFRQQTAGLGIEAASAGNWGNRLRVDVIPRTPAPSASRFDLAVTLAPGPDPTQPQEAERFVNLSLDPTDPRFAPTIVNHLVAGSNLIRLDVPQSFTALPVSNGIVSPFPVTLAGGRDGLSEVTAEDFIGGDGDFRGLRVLEEVDEVGILIAPDAVNAGQTSLLPQNSTPPSDPCAAPTPTPTAPPAPEPDDPTAPPRPLPAFDASSGAGAIYLAMIEQAAQLRYRVAVVDTPDNLEPTAVNTWLTSLALPPAMVMFATVYYPWLLVPDGLTNELATRRVPPGGHAAGVYAQIDNSVGVQHPPANVELDFAVDVGRPVSDSQQGQLNEQGINVIRSFPGRGIRVWGARSLAASYDDQEDWWFIHVRRTMSMIEDSVEKSMQWTVFENNDDTLRRTLTHSLTVFLEQIWLSGGLKGASASEAFYVKCDDTNNPQTQVDMGWLVCEVGVAVAAPMEFLTFQVQRQPDGTGVVEA